MKWIDSFMSPVGQRRFHGALTLFWILMIPPAVFWFSQNILYVVLISQYANYISEFTAWLAARTEVRAQSLEDHSYNVLQHLENMLERLTGIEMNGNGGHEPVPAIDVVES